MKLCTRCDRDESVGIHVVFRRAGKEIDHLCRLPGEGSITVNLDTQCASVWAPENATATWIRLHRFADRRFRGCE